ncbi:hypothetical protein [Pedobacter sp. UBA4863]|uniref:hypothetical protein n=1 Tax=Pedobacter sp. UBA4863 TaxID=1947060 RepID=UPI0025F9BA00|nr:hypothetical protein [Pedobacter sp. UBA4863]
MRNKISAKPYGLSASSKLAGVYFKQANVFASSIYGGFIGFEPRFAARETYQRLLRLLVKLYHSDTPHYGKEKRLCRGDVALLKKWRIQKGVDWHSSYGLVIGLDTVINGEGLDVTLRLNANGWFCGKEALKGIAPYYYVFLINEDTRHVEVQATDYLEFHITRTYGDFLSAFKFRPVDKGIVMVIAVVRPILMTKGDKRVYISENKHYFKAAVIYSIGIFEGQLHSYVAKTANNEPAVSARAKVAWQSS